MGALGILAIVLTVFSFQYDWYDGLKLPDPIIEDQIQYFTTCLGYGVTGVSLIVMTSAKGCDKTYVIGALICFLIVTTGFFLIGSLQTGFIQNDPFAQHTIQQAIEGSDGAL